MTNAGNLTHDPSSNAQKPEEFLGADDEMTFEVEAAPPPDDAALKKVAYYAEHQAKLVRWLENAEELMKKRREMLKRVAEVDLPQAMKDVGMRSFELIGGGSVSLKDVVSASIPKENKEDVLAFVAEDGHESLIKRTFTIFFGRDQEKEVAKFIRDLNKRKVKLDVKRDDKIEPATYKKYIKDRIERLQLKKIDPFLGTPKGTPKENAVLGTPKEEFGIYTATVAEVELPKVAAP